MEKQTNNTQPQYIGYESIYKHSTRWWFNPYEFDVLKRLTRCRHKGTFEQDINKSIDVLDIMLKEYDWNSECFNYLLEKKTNLCTGVKMALEYKEEYKLNDIEHLIVMKMFNKYNNINEYVDELKYLLRSYLETNNKHNDKTGSNR